MPALHRTDAVQPIINPDENAKRRKIILQKMVDQGYISEQQQQDALADDVYSRIQKTAQETDEVSIYSYYTDALIEQVKVTLWKSRDTPDSRLTSCLLQAV